MTTEDQDLERIIRDVLAENGIDDPQLFKDLVGIAKSERASAPSRGEREAQPEFAYLSEDEQALVRLLRQNRCGDPDCESVRLLAARKCLLGGTTHREFAAVVVHQVAITGQGPDVARVAAPGARPTPPPTTEPLLNRLDDFADNAFVPSEQRAILREIIRELRATSAPEEPR